jgi:hypothetical protein
MTAVTREVYMAPHVLQRLHLRSLAIIRPPPEISPYYDDNDYEQGNCPEKPYENITAKLKARLGAFQAEDIEPRPEALVMLGDVLREALDRRNAAEAKARREEEDAAADRVLGFIGIKPSQKAAPETFQQEVQCTARHIDCAYVSKDER